MVELAHPACIAQVPPIATHNHQFTHPESQSATDYIWEFLSLNASLKSCWILVNLSVKLRTHHRDSRCTFFFSLNREIKAASQIQSVSIYLSEQGLMDVQEAWSNF